MYAERQIETLEPAFNPMQVPLGDAMLETELHGLSIDSNELLRGRKAVAIVHNGAVYRLQATKLGKLILTK